MAINDTAGRCVCLAPRPSDVADAQCAAGNNSGWLIQAVKVCLCVGRRRSRHLRAA